VCDLIGIHVPHEEGEYGKVDGVSLMPLVRNDAQSVRPYSFAENGTLVSVQDPRWKLVVAAAEAEPPPPGGSFDGHPEPSPWLVDLEQDPGETRNVVAEHQDEAKRLFDALHAWSASMPIRKADAVLSQREIDAQLRAMQGTGYGGKGHFPGQPGKQ
jgi:hypothetical protein